MLHHCLANLAYICIYHLTKSQHYHKTVFMVCSGHIKLDKKVLVSYKQPLFWKFVTDGGTLEVQPANRVWVTWAFTLYILQFIFFIILTWCTFLIIWRITHITQPRSYTPSPGSFLEHNGIITSDWKLAGSLTSPTGFADSSTWAPFLDLQKRGKVKVQWWIGPQDNHCSNFLVLCFTSVRETFTKLDWLFGIFRPGTQAPESWVGAAHRHWERWGTSLSRWHSL